MSKRRPSRAAPRHPASARARTDLAYWRSRLLRNTFTRAGQRFQVRSWSVKIQHEGQRRTVALRTTRRATAARRARALYRAVVTLGWDTVLAHPGAVPGVTPGPARRATASWTPRLLRRPYTDCLRAPGQGSLAVQIEHLGTRHYFPLGTDHPDEAARMARRIYHTVVAEGWSAARSRFRRELTVAVFWSTNPIACTYATLFSEPDPFPESATAAGLRTRTPVALVEPDAGTRRALARWIDRHARARCETRLATGPAALRWAARGRPGVLLVSRDLPALTGAACLEALRSRRPDLPVLGYGVYEDSDQLFLSLMGVSGGYLLRRRPPEALLEPLDPAAAKPLTARQATQLVRRYFRGLLDAPSGEAEPLAFAGLTPREQEILGELSRGAADKDIAGRLGISAWTVRGHLKRIYEKLGVHTRTEAAVRYLEK